MPVVTPFVSYARLDSDRVRPILEALAPYGLRFWIDDKDLRGALGYDLSYVLPQAIYAPQTTSQLAFISRNALDREWFLEELRHGLKGREHGRRLIPVVLDPVRELIPRMPAEVRELLRVREDEIHTLYLDPTRNGFPRQAVASVMSAAGLSTGTEAVLHLGHRCERFEPDIPASWLAHPAIDLRSSHTVEGRDYCPTLKRWAELRRGLNALKLELPKLTSLRICGETPLAMAALVGWVWDRNTHVKMTTWNKYTAQEWSAERIDLQAVEGWTPERALALAGVEAARQPGSEASTVVLGTFTKGAYWSDFLQWMDQKEGEFPAVRLAYPMKVSSEAEARALIQDTLGALSWVRRIWPSVRHFKWGNSLPLALTALLAREMVNYGSFEVYDQVRGVGRASYRVAGKKG